MLRASLDLPVTIPNEPLVGSVTGLLQLAWFITSNISNRNCRRCDSYTLKFLRRPMSQLQYPGPRRLFLTCVPKLPAAGCVNAALLNQSAELVNGVRATSVSPESVQN